MQEDFIRHIWFYQLFNPVLLYTVQKDFIQILDKGQQVKRAGPDFFSAQLILNRQKWAGNIEILVNASDWYLHHHKNETVNDNVILHVVWNYDAQVFRNDGSAIAVLELKHIVPEKLLTKWDEVQKEFLHFSMEIKMENEVSQSLQQLKNQMYNKGHSSPSESF